MDNLSTCPPNQRPLWLHSIAGGLAGTAVDAILFPLDTLKTRLQSGIGFNQTGAFLKVYRGFSSILIGSAPGAALFFFTYESLKRTAGSIHPRLQDSVPLLIVSSSLAEVTACAIRVPVEVLKQRMQVNQYKGNLFTSARSLLLHEGIRGFYRGFRATVQREIPFACLQYPLYELFKMQWHKLASARSQTPTELSSDKAALCGCLAGGLTAALTTPFDVLKTRTMLSSAKEVYQFRSSWHGFHSLLREGGIRKLFAGIGPRVAWISIGGFIFFGVYEKTIAILQA